MLEILLSAMELKSRCNSFDKYFAIHLSKYDIRVNCVSPGGVFNNQGIDFVKNYNKKTPLGRMANEKKLQKQYYFYPQINLIILLVKILLLMVVGQVGSISNFFK